MTHLREKNALWNDLTDEQSEKLVGGVGVCTDHDSDCGAGGSAGVQGWFGNGGPPANNPANHGLFGAGFAPGSMIAGGSGNKIIIPTKP